MYPPQTAFKELVYHTNLSLKYLLLSNVDHCSGCKIQGTEQILKARNSLFLAAACSVPLVTGLVLFKRM